MALEDLARQLQAGSRRALGRALSIVESGGVPAQQLLAALQPPFSPPRIVGFTGPPGVGKSTLVEAVGVQLLKRGERVAVLAVDPSSPFSGGALLGDRLRMGEFTARGGFVRSVATRGALGGVAAATFDFLQVLAAAKFSWILVETVGVGQDEVDVAGVVDTVVLVLVAGMGDEVQAAKAGLMEAAHIFVVNKADRPGADRYVELLLHALRLGPTTPWQPRVLKTVAAAGEGVEGLLQAVEAHRAFLDHRGKRGQLRQAQALRRLREAVNALVWQELHSSCQGALEEASARIAQGTADPFSVARELVEWLRRSS